MIAAILLVLVVVVTVAGWCRFFSGRHRDCGGKFYDYGGSPRALGLGYGHMERCDKCGEEIYVSDY